MENNGIEEQEFWETAFNEKNEMWGFEAANAAVLAKDLFVENAAQNILIPGIGYGRNAQVFAGAGMAVTGIEISATAIAMARKHYGDSMKIYHGPVTDMPFDEKIYDGIFCHALIHLLDEDERKKLISDCYNQLADGGHMVFTVITKEASTYRQGIEVGKDRYEMFGGVKMFFYDRETVNAEFGKTGLYEVLDIMENYPFFMIVCRK